MTDISRLPPSDTPPRRRVVEDEEDIIRRLSAEAKLRIYEEVKELLDAKAAHDARRSSISPDALEVPASTPTPARPAMKAGLDAGQPREPDRESKPDRAESSDLIILSEEGSYQLNDRGANPDSALDSPSPAPRRGKAGRQEASPPAKDGDGKAQQGHRERDSLISDIPVAGSGGNSPAKRFTLLTGLSEDQVKLLRNSGTKQKFENGETIFSSGDKAGGVYIILRGRVEVEMETGGLEHISRRRSGEWFGELEMMTSAAHRRATATAVRPTSLFEIPGNPLDLFRWLSDRKAAMRLLRNSICLMGRHLREMGEESAKQPSKEHHQLHDSSPTANWEEARTLLPHGLWERIEKCRSFQEARLLDGQHLYREGDMPGGFYFIQAGTLDVFRKSGKRQRKLSTLEGPMIIGDVSFFSHHERSVSVRAFGPVRYLKFSGERFNRVKKRDTEETLDLLLLCAEFAAGLQRIRQGVVRS